HKTAEGHDSERCHRPGRPPKAYTRVMSSALRPRLFRRKPLVGENSDGTQKQRWPERAVERCHADRRERAADKCAGDPSNAVEAVERRHERPLIQTFND